MHLFRTLLLLAVFLGPLNAAATSEASTAASGLSLIAGANIVEGSVALLNASSDLIIVSAETVGEASVLVLRGLGESLATTVTISVESVGALSTASGQIVRVLTSASGKILVFAGEVIAFVPDAVGRALLHHEVIAQ